MQMDWNFWYIVNYINNTKILTKLHWNLELDKWKQVLKNYINNNICYCARTVV